MIEWKDVTSYSQRGEKTPHWWTAKLGGLRLSVGNSHIYYPDGDTWLLHCAPWFDTRPLSAKNEADAKREALGLVTSELLKSLAELGRKP